MHGPVCLSKQTIRFEFVSFEKKTKNRSSFPRPLTCNFISHKQPSLITMNIKSYLCLAFFTCLSAISAHGHCQVPCGIFADQHRFEQMLEDQATIEKAGKLIAELSGKKDALSQNQLSRWVATKEAHAYNIQKVIAEYFLAQRIKATAKNYEKQLVSAHGVIVAAMKCKQNVDADSSANLKKAILALHKSYEQKK